jgi:hypothetical protein
MSRTLILFRRIRGRGRIVWSCNRGSSKCVSSYNGICMLLWKRRVRYIDRSSEHKHGRTHPIDKRIQHHSNKLVECYTNDCAHLWQRCVEALPWLRSWLETTEPPHDMLVLQVPLGLNPETYWSQGLLSRFVFLMKWWSDQQSINQSTPTCS